MTGALVLHSSRIERLSIIDYLGLKPEETAFFVSGGLFSVITTGSFDPDSNWASLLHIRRRQWVLSLFACQYGADYSAQLDDGKAYLMKQTLAGTNRHFGSFLKDALHGVLHSSKGDCHTLA
jgi:hypothetical protein